jgi:hypothetical protein
MAPVAVEKPLPPAARNGSPGPKSFEDARAQVLRGNSNYHSTSLRNLMSRTVNKTTLHPLGVE